MTDNEIRESIMNSKENIIVSAGAGSGKTTLLTNKILKEIEENKSHYKIAAITFTNKAANEIKERLKGKGRGCFIGNNDSFVMNEIIIQFIKDAYGDDFDNEFIITYTKNKFDTYNQGIDLLKQKKILATYNNKMRNFKFELALNILKKSKVAEQYIKAKYRRLYIDEYQDTDDDMNKLFMYIKELGVKLFIVGDIKQSIYTWKGAKPEIFKEIFDNQDNGFEKFTLTENFRCSVSIQNYANVIEHKTIKVYKEENENEIDVIGVYEYPLNQVDMEKEIAILVRTNSSAIEVEKECKDLGYDFIFIPRTPLDDLGNDNKNILIELAKYTKNKMYSHYNFINNIPGEFCKSEILEIKNIIEPLKAKTITEEKIESIIIELFAYLGLKFFGNKEIEAFSKSVLDKTFENSFNGKQFKHKIMTVHSSKGLEFEQVVIFSSNYRIYQDRDKEEHYVATTRAEKKLIVVFDDEYYLNYIGKLFDSIGIDINKLIKIIEYN